MIPAQLELYAAFTGVGRGAGGTDPRAIPSNEPPYGAGAATIGGRYCMGGGVTGAYAGIGRGAASTIGRGGGVTGVRTSARASAMRGATRCSD